MRRSWVCLRRAGALASAVLLLAGAAPAPSPPKRTNLVLITAEGLRPDRLGCYGTKGSATTPSIDRLAADSVLFEKTLAPSSSSLPSLATLLTGRYPFQHQVWEDDHRNRLPKGVATLAERLHKEGYRTGAFLATSRLAGERGLGRGFDRYQDGYQPPPTGTWKLVQRAGKVILPEVNSWLETGGSRPFFLWVHFIETAMPTPSTSTEPTKDARAGYDRKVEALDARVGELLKVLRDRKSYEGTVVVLSADHGMGLGDHGELRSGVFLYDSTVRVPLLVKPPAGHPRKGGRVQDLAGLVDVVPTLERLLGLPPTAGLPGRNLLSTSPGGASAYYAVALMGREVFGWAPSELVARGDERLITGAGVELYDLASDRGQEKDLSASRPSEVQAMKALRQKITGGASLPPHYASTVKLAGNLSRRLVETGCVDPTRPAARSRPLPDPRRLRKALPLLEAVHLAAEVAGPVAMASVENSLLEENPEGRFTLLNAAQLNIARGVKVEGALDRAAAQLKRVQHLYPLDPEVYHQLAHLAFTQGHLQEAELFLQVSKSLSPLYPAEVGYDLACAYALQGKRGEALAELRGGIRLGFRDLRHISADPDLASLRSDPAYRRLIEEEFPSAATQ